MVCIRPVDALGIQVAVDDLQSSGYRQFFHDLGVAPTGHASDVPDIARDPVGYG